MTESTLAARIAKLRELEAKATPGPWHEYANTVVYGDPKGQDIRADREPDDRVARDMTSADMEFVACLRNNALAIIEELEAENERLNEVLAAAECIEGPSSWFADVMQEPIRRLHAAIRKAKGISVGGKYAND